jgi:zinc transport system substrate-binding protein
VAGPRLTEYEGMRRAIILVGGVTVSSLLAASTSVYAAAQPKVVVTIKPLHALVAKVMSGAGTPELLVKGEASPHTFSLRPSEIRALSGADLFFRASETIEPFTAKIVTALPGSVEIVTLQDAPGVKLLAQRTGITFERHAAHGHGSHAHSHKARAIDGHAWLDPRNAKSMVARIAQVLVAKYPEHASRFESNADNLRTTLDALASDLGRELEPVAGRPYVVFHDALQYLERRYDLNVVGSISVSPEVPPSGKRLAELRRKIVSLEAVCVFAEPGFDRRLVANLIEGTNARTGTLDPEGIRLQPGPDLYPTLMRRLAADIKSCLAP